MKKQTLFSLIAISVITFSACKKEEEEIKTTESEFEEFEGPIRVTSIKTIEENFHYNYNESGNLETVKYEEDGYVSRTDSFIYTDDNKLEKLIYKHTGNSHFDQYSYSYEENKTIIEKHYFDGSTFKPERTDSLFFDEEGLPSKHFRGAPDASWTYYKWKNGNLIQVEEEYKIYDFEYDNMEYWGKGLFEHYDENGFEFESKNNVTKITETIKSDGSQSIQNNTYKYNNLNYPGSIGEGWFQYEFEYEEY